MVPVPPSWSRNIVSFKTYDTGGNDGRALWDWANSHFAELKPHKFKGESDIPLATCLGTGSCEDPRQKTPSQLL